MTNHTHTHGPRLSAEKYHEQAKKAINATESLPGGERVRRHTGQKLNVFKYQMYYNIIHRENVDVNGQANPDTISAIHDHLEATQIFLKELGAVNSDGTPLTTDGKMGKNTAAAIKKYFGIDISVGSVDVENINVGIMTPAQKLMLRRAILSNAKLKSEMRKLGVKFKKDDVIFPEGFEKTEEYKQMQLYLKGLYMTLSPEYTKPELLTDEKRKEKVELYFKLVRESGDFIVGKEYIGYKLIHSMYQDIKREDLLMVRSGRESGKYDIVKFPITRDEETHTVTSERARANHPYRKLIEGGTVKAEYIEFSMTYSLIDTNSTVFKGKDFMGQRTLVEAIIDKHKITGISPESLQKSNHLLADWDVVQEDIREKMAAVTTSNEAEGFGKSIEAYEELAYLQNLIEGKEWLSKKKNQTLFNEVNTYGKGFLAEKALINEHIDHQTGGVNDAESIGESIKNVANSNALAILGFGAFSMIFGSEKWKNGGFLLILGLLGANVAGGVIDKVIERTGTPGEGPGDRLELLTLGDIAYRLDVPEYQEKYEALLEKNKDFGEKRYDSNNVELPFLKNKVLFNITNAITSKYIDVELLDSDSDTAAALGDTLKNGDGSSMFTPKELLSYVQILKKSGVKEADDTTTLDIFSVGLDTANESYDFLKFIGEDTFDKNLNKIFMDKYNKPGITRGERKKLIANRKKIYDILNSNISNPSTTTDGYFDLIITRAEQAAKGVANYSIDGLNGAKEYFNWSTNFDESKIMEVEAYLAQNNIEIKDSVVNSLKSYKTFYEASAQVEKFQGIWDTNANDAWKILYTVIGTGGIAFDALENAEESAKTNLSLNIDTQVQSLEKLKTEIQGKPEPFLSLVEKITTTIGNLKQTQANLGADYASQNVLDEETIKGAFSTDSEVQSLKATMKSDLDTIENFIRLGRVNLGSLEDIETIYERLSAYSTYLNGATVSGGNNTIINVMKQEIIDTRDTFTKTGGAKEQFEALVRQNLTDTYAQYNGVKTNLDAITPNDSLDISLGSLSEGERFLQEKIEDNSIEAYITQQSDFIATSWETIKSFGGASIDAAVSGIDAALSAGGTAVDVAQAGLGTLAYATWTLDYFTKIGDKFDELLRAERASGNPNPQVVQQIQNIQSAIATVAQRLQKLREIDQKNAEILRKAKEILGTSFSVPRSNVSLESIQKTLARKRGEIEGGVLQHLNSIDYVNIDSTQRTQELENITKIQRFFPDKPAIMQKTREVKEALFYSQPLVDLTDWDTAINGDLVEVRKKIDGGSISTSEKTNLENVEKFLQILSGVPVADYSINGVDYSSLQGNTSITVQEFVTEILKTLNLADNNSKKSFLGENLPNINDILK